MYVLSYLFVYAYACIDIDIDRYIGVDLYRYTYIHIHREATVEALKSAKDVIVVRNCVYDVLI